MSASPIRLTYTPIPNTFLGSFLSNIENLTELKCALRIFWPLNRAKGSIRTTPIEDLSRDPVILAALNTREDSGRLAKDSTPVESDDGLAQVIKGLVNNGVFVVLAKSDDDNNTQVIALNTPQNLAKVNALGLCEVPIDRLERLRHHHSRAERDTIFHLYEANIGLLTPIIAEELKAGKYTMTQERLRT